MSETPIRTLIRDLESALREEGRNARVARLLESYAGHQVDWREFALFQPGCYARNLVSGCELFELLVLCWQPGQVSPIHDHQGQRVAGCPSLQARFASASTTCPGREPPDPWWLGGHGFWSAVRSPTSTMTSPCTTSDLWAGGDHPAPVLASHPRVPHLRPADGCRDPARLVYHSIEGVVQS